MATLPTAHKVDRGSLTSSFVRALAFISNHHAVSDELFQVANAVSAYFSPSWTAFQADRGRDFSVIVDGVSN